ncbi:unnamed protein product [Knipowitschia caucasica]|uniref:Uncharacterized protein n=1 Tax=Knipowitschia caucasica TaxID=637954 RepID=A0AAV2JUB9_KNICA
MAHITHSMNGHCSEKKIRKPHVEKRRRARINDSLQVLRLLTDADVRIENADVLENTVRRVESVLQNRAHEVEVMNQEACERFAAGYIQCMHDVHSFVSSCPEIEPPVVTELLNHLLDSMPLNEEQLRLQVPDSLDEFQCSGLVSPRPSMSSDEPESDLDETESEHAHVSSDGSDVLCLPSFHSKFMWRPW